MHSDTRVPARLGSGVSIVDLEDFPHGELCDLRVDDKYNIEFYAVPGGIMVKSYNPTTSKTEWMPVKYWSVHRGKNTEIVTLTDGSQIYTDDDPRAVFGVASDATTATPERFTPSDALSRNVLVPLSPVEAHDCTAEAWYCLDNGEITSHHADRATPIDFQFGQFIGVIAGDGRTDARSRLLLADKAGFNYSFVESFLRRHYPEMTVRSQALDGDAPGRCGPTVKYRFNTGNGDLARRVKELVGGHGDDCASAAASKRLPVWYQAADKEFIRGIVCGLIAADGTVAVLHGKAKPQLSVQFTSTSLRLSREFQRCCRILGVRCRVSFSKTTSAGNASWLCAVSATDAKRVNLLDGCCHADKLATFGNAIVSDAPCNSHNDVVPFPKDIAGVIVAAIPAPSPKSRPRTQEERDLATISRCVRRDAKAGRITRWRARSVAAYASSAASSASMAYESAKLAFAPVMQSVLRAYEARCPDAPSGAVTVPITKDVAAAVRAGVVACRSRLAAAKDPILESVVAVTYTAATQGFLSLRNAARIKNFFDTHTPNTELRDSEALRKLMQLVESPVRWEGVEKVEKTGVGHVGYDLTVPGYDTFMNSDGVILSNTMNFHVPASDKAVAEAAEKMLPSKNLFSTTDLRSPRYTPLMEMTLGLAKLTGPASNKKPRVFATKQDVIQAYRRGEIGATDPVQVLG